jgi:hypothetical protein
MRRFPFALLGAALLVLVTTSSSVAFAADAGKGTFRFGKVHFQPVDTLAYRQEGKDPAKPVTVVALTNFKIDCQAVVRDGVAALMRRRNDLVVQTSPLLIFFGKRRDRFR